MAISISKLGTGSLNPHQIPILPIGLKPLEPQPVESTPIESDPIQNTSFNITYVFAVTSQPSPSAGMLTFNINVLPAVPVFSGVDVSLPILINFVPIPLFLKDSILDTFKALTANKIENFFDVTRQGKTLLNFGDDFQTLLTNWKSDSTNNDESSLIVKLYTPLPTEVPEKTHLWVTRELSPAVIDRLYIINTPPEPDKVYLRPPNRNVQLTGRMGSFIENATLSTLLSTGSLLPVNPNDQVINEWYTDDINSAELNINYADYRTFVFFGSAAARLKAFVNKLSTLESYNSQISFNSGSLTVSGSSTLVNKLAFPALKLVSEKRVDLLRTFDGYERFLYYASGSAYSSSLNTNHSQDALYYNADATWPKINGVVAPVASGSGWLTTQLSIANAYDVANANYLKNNLPTYIQNDDASQEFIQFINLIGHQFDAIKTYIDGMSNIYNRSSNPSEALSPDIIWNIAQSFGVEMPNQYAIKRLVDYTIGDTTVPSPKVYRQIASETWKRFLHNQIFMMKSKGTKTSLRTLANSYGILPSTLQIREFGTVGPDDTSESYHTYDEQTNVLNMVSGSYISIPMVSGSIPSHNTVEIRFSTTNNTSPTVILTDASSSAVVLNPTGGIYGQIILSGSGVPTGSFNLVSDILPIYSGNFYSVVVRRNTTSPTIQNNSNLGVYDYMDLFVTRCEGGVAIEKSHVREPVDSSLANNTFAPTRWATMNKMLVGQSGSVFGAPFVGQVDEVRIWGESLTDDVISQHALYPGVYNGNVPTSVRDSLFVRLSFNVASNLGVTALVYDESPKQLVKNGFWVTNGFPNISTAPYNFSIILREITKFNPTAGHHYSSNKIIIDKSSSDAAHYYSFGNGFNDVYGGPSLSGSVQGLYGGNFVFGPASGLKINNALKDGRVYSIAYKMNLVDPSNLATTTNTGNQKIIDFKGLTLDKGVYVNNGSYNIALENSGLSTGRGLIERASNTVCVSSPLLDHTTVITRDASDLFTIYVDNVLQFQMRDIAGDAIFNVKNAEINLFLDDVQTSGAEGTSGSVSYIAMWNRALSNTEATSFDLINGITPRPSYLSRTNSVVSLPKKETKHTNSNVVGFYFSTSDAVNDSITRSVGIVDLQNLIGDPADQFSGNYAALNSINDLYWTQYAYIYNVNKFVDFVRNLLDPLFKQARELVPARVKLLSGIVHEPHILERSKQPLKPVTVTAGALTRKIQNDTYNLESKVVSPLPNSITGITGPLRGTVTLQTTTHTLAETEGYTTVVSGSVAKIPTGLYFNFDTSVGVYSNVKYTSNINNYASNTIAPIQSTHISSGYVTFDDTSNRAAIISLFLSNNNTISYGALSPTAQQQYNDLLARYRSPSSINVFDQYIAPSVNRMSGFAPVAQTTMVMPFTNFDDIESKTYFSDSSGLIGELGYATVRVNGKVLTSQGTWTAGVTYKRNDYVIQLNSVAAPDGNGKEFRCVTTNGTVAGYIEPFLDTANWQPVSYTTINAGVIKKAILVNNVVSLAPSGSLSAPVIGYRPQHYKFTRDNRLGVLRHLWIGCTQDKFTTTDGKDPVEIKTSTGNALFVVHGDPVQSTDDGTGPILDVR